MPKGPRILSTPESPVLGCAAPTGLCKTEDGAWLVVKRGAVKGVHRGIGSKRAAIAQAGSNVVIA